MEETNEVRIGRYLAGEMTVNEREALEQEMAADAGLKAVYLDSRKIWEMKAPVSEIEWDTEKAWLRFAEGNIEQKDKVKKYRRLLMWSAAAAVVMVFGVYFAFFGTGSPVTYAYQEGMKNPVILKDGTKVYLNKASSVTVYPYTKQKRHLELTGEAYFEVQPDKVRPFTIATGETMTEVVGTSFNIRQEEGRTHIFVNSGKIIFSSMEDEHIAVALTEGEAAVFGANKMELIANPSPNVNAWRTRQLRFIKMPLETVVADVSAYFDEKIIIENEASKACIINIPIAFKKPEISSVLTAVAASINAKLVKEGDTYFIRGGRTCS